MALKKTKSSSPTPKAEKKRQEILKAAAKRFRKTGFHQTSMQEICAETALGPGAVYRYFPSKDAIIEAMAEDERTEARAILSDLGETGNFDDVLQSIGKALNERYKNNSDTGMMTEVYAEGLRNKHVGLLVRKSENEWIDGLTGLLQKAQANEQIDSTIDARHAALLLTAMWDGMIIRNAYHPDDKSPELTLFFDAMLKKLLRKEGAAADKVDAATKPAKRTKPTTPPLPMPSPSPSLFDEVQVHEPEIDVRQMSLI